MMDEISTKLEAKLALSSEGGKIDYGEVEKQARDTEACFSVGKLLTNKKFSLKQEVRAFISDWTLKGKDKIAENKNGKYDFRFDALEDAHDLFDGGPWSFRNTLLMTQVLDGTEDPVDVELESMPLWVEIKGLKPALELVGETLGAFVKIDPIKCEQDVYKVRLLQDIKKPLRLGGELEAKIVGGDKECWRQRLLAAAALAVPTLEANPEELEQVGLAYNESKGLTLAPQTTAYWACKLSPLMHLKFIFMKTIEEEPSVAPEKN